MNKTNIAVRVLVLLFALLCLTPMAVTVLNSFMSQQEVQAPMHLLPYDFSLFQFERILLRTPQYLIWFWNSCRITVCTVLIAIPVGLAAGFGFAKYEFPFKDTLFFIYIIVMLLPFQATVVPQYITLKGLGLLNTPAAVILPGAFGAFGVFLLTQFIKGIDEEYMDAARMDGMGHWGVFTRIVVPLSKPGVAALAILLCIESWAMIEQPLIFLRDAATWPLSLYLGNISSTLYAGGLLFLMPPLLIYLSGYEYLVEGIALGSVK
jgi:multiple sugar transport system permease protein